MRYFANAQNLNPSNYLPHGPNKFTIDIEHHSTHDKTSNTQSSQTPKQEGTYLISMLTHILETGI